MIKLLVADLDNTLLKNDKTISDYTANVFKRCRSQGIKIAFATARSEKGCFRFIRQIQPDLFIGCGGALVLEGEQIIYRFYMPKDASRALLCQCLSVPEISFIYAINESIALTSDPDLPLQEDYGHYRYSDFSHDLDRHYLKISVHSESPEAVERIAAKFPQLDMLRYTGEPLYRFSSPDAVKWNAVKAAAGHCGIDRKEIVCFGDDTIDLEMIRESGTGVAVENATEEVKAAADYICGSNEDDGVAAWIEKHVLFSPPGLVEGGSAPSGTKEGR